MTVLDEIQAERNRQNQQWGGSRHDEQHMPLEWIGLLAKHLGLCAAAVFAADWSQFRHRLLIIAALAVAGIESYDSLLEEARAGSPFVQFSADVPATREGR